MPKMLINPSFVEKPLKVKPFNVLTSKIVHYGYTYPKILINPSFVKQTFPRFN